MVVYYAMTGSANLAVALVLAAGWVRLPRVALGVLGTLLWCVGYLMMPAASAYLVVAMAGLTIGAGQGCFMAAVIPILNALVEPGQRRQMFALRFAVLNATLAGGSLVAGMITVLVSRAAIPYLFVANAIGMLPVTWVLLASRRHTDRQPAPSSPAPVSPAPVSPAPVSPAPVSAQPLPVWALVRISLPVMLFQLTAFLLGFSQFEATSPLVTERLMHMGLLTVSTMLAVNVGVIVVFQRVVTRLLAGRAETFGLRVAVGLWVTGYLFAGVLASAPYELRLAGLLGYAVLFGLGECAYSCSFHPWLISSVPDSELTRANALANSMMGIGNFAGPSIGVGLALAGQAAVVWFGLAACCTVAAVAIVVLAQATAARQQDSPTVDGRLVG